MNLFGNYFRASLVLTVVFFILSGIGFYHHSIAILAYSVAILFVLIISFFNLQYGVYAILTELFVGGHGHLFDLYIGKFTLSLRMGMFVVVLLAWLIKILQTLLRNRAMRECDYMSFFRPSNFRLWYVLLAFMLLLGFIEGVAFGNERSLLFADINGWFFYALAGVFFAVFSDIKKEKLLDAVAQILIAAIVWHFIQAVLLEIIFSHKDDFWVIYKPLTGIVYKWLRDLRMFEIGIFSSGSRFFRIFSPSFITSLVGYFVFLWLMIGNQLQRLDKANYTPHIRQAAYIWLIFSLATTTLFLSLSRAFWVGLAIAFVGTLLFAVAYFKLSRHGLAILAGKIFASIVFAVIVAVIAVNIPISRIIPFSYPTSAFFERATSRDDAGISSRWALLPVLNKAILEKPLLGHGFGKTVRYQSQDPRILQSSRGEYTTYVFEWGYHDIIVKIGLIGFLIYAILLLAILWSGIKLMRNSRYSRSDSFMIRHGLLFGFFAVLATHFFSPYLNHPIGIGYVLLMSSLLVKPGSKTSFLTK